MLDERLAVCSRISVAASDGGVVLKVSCGGAVNARPVFSDFGLVGVLKKFRSPYPQSLGLLVSVLVSILFPSPSSQASSLARLGASDVSLSSGMLSEPPEAEWSISSLSRTTQLGALVSSWPWMSSSRSAGARSRWACDCCRGLHGLFFTMVVDLWGSSTVKPLLKGHGVRSNCSTSASTFLKLSTCSCSSAQVLGNSIL